MPRYKSANYFVPHQSNTICDVTGFKKKTNEVVKRWDGFYVISEADNPRQPQDFPPTIIPTQTFPHTRFELVPAIEPDLGVGAYVLDSDGNSFFASNVVLNSSSTGFTVSDYVKDADGNGFEIFGSASPLEII
jgi:hypothetical protein